MSDDTVSGYEVFGKMAHGRPEHRLAHDGWTHRWDSPGINLTKGFRRIWYDQLDWLNRFGTVRFERCKCEACVAREPEPSGKDERIAKLERENAELKSRLESSKIVNSKMAEEFFDLKRTAEEQLTRLRAVARAAMAYAHGGFIVDGQRPDERLVKELDALEPGDAEVHSNG